VLSSVCGHRLSPSRIPIPLHTTRPNRAFGACCAGDRGRDPRGRPGHSLRNRNSTFDPDSPVQWPWSDPRPSDTPHRAPLRSSPSRVLIMRSPRARYQGFPSVFTSLSTRASNSFGDIGDPGRIAPARSPKGLGVRKPLEARIHGIPRSHPFPHARGGPHPGPNETECRCRGLCDPITHRKTSIAAIPNTGKIHHHP